MMAAAASAARPTPVTLENLLTTTPVPVERLFRSEGMAKALVRVWQERPPQRLPNFAFTFPDTLHQLFRQVGESVSDRSISNFCCNRRLAELRAKKKITVGVFGGSVTSGTGCGSTKGVCSWPSFMELILRSLGWDATVHNCAVGGSTTEMSVDLVMARACGAYDMYIVAHGANDDVEFSENYSPVQTERVAHVIQDLVHVVRETVNNSLVLVWDEMPARQFMSTNGSRFENAMVAHQIGAASVSAPSLSFFQSLYVDYLTHPGDRLYFRRDEVHPRYPAFLLIAAVLADYINASPLSMPTPSEHDVHHTCNRQLLLANQSLPGVTVTQDGWNAARDTHGRVNWITHGKGEWIQFDFAKPVTEVAVIHLKSYSEGWGKFQASADGHRGKIFSSMWLRRASVYSRGFVTSGVHNLLRLEAVAGKNQIRSISFCMK